MEKLLGHTLAMPAAPSAADPSHALRLAVVMRPGLPIVPHLGHPLGLDEFYRRHGPPASIRESIIRWLSGHGLMIEQADPLIIWCTGSRRAIADTFSTRIWQAQAAGRTVFGPETDPELPGHLAKWVTAVVGLDNVAVARPWHRVPADASKAAHGGQGYFPADIARAYRFPAGGTGFGITIGLLEFSNGYSASDVNAFWQAFGIAAPDVQFVSVDGTPNDGGLSPVDLEATLDVEWAGAMAPGARVVVYEASAGSSDTAFGLSMLRALHFAIHDRARRPTVLSISYGDGESRFAPATMRAWDQVMQQAAALGVTTVVASGDQGAYGLQTPGRPVLHVDAPANCPHALAVGGTSLTLNPDGSIQNQTGWTDTNNNGASGGGISQVFGVPTYQSELTLPVRAGEHPGRGVPDVALNADPDTGYAVVFQGTSTVVGGTSVAAPIWAAIIARLQEARRRHNQATAGFVNPALYALGGTPSFDDVLVGNNSYDGVPGYQCGPGWDAVTGWGTPVVDRLLSALGG